MKRQCSRCKQKLSEDAFDGNYKCCGRCRRYNKATRPKNGNRNRKRGRGRTPTVVMGRKFCSDCGRWRHLMDFGVAVWNDPIERTSPHYFRSECHHCERLRGREKNARLNGRDEPYGQRQPGMSPEQKRKRWNEMEHQRRQNPEYLERRREYQRIWAEGRRRAQGIRPRSEMIKNRNIGDPRFTDPRFPLGPFQNWIRERAAYYARFELLDEAYNHRNGAVVGMKYLAQLCKISDRSLRRYLDGSDDSVLLSTVDHCLTNEGTTFVWELYEDAYTETMATELQSTC